MLYMDVYVWRCAREVSITGGEYVTVCYTVYMLCSYVYYVYIIYMYIYFIDNALRGKRETARKR